MYQKNLKELKEKISREQAILELRGEVTISYEERTIQVITIEYEDARGTKLETKSSPVQRKPSPQLAEKLATN